MASKIVKLQFHHAELSLRNNRQSTRLQTLLHRPPWGTGKRRPIQFKNIAEKVGLIGLKGPEVVKVEEPRMASMCSLPSEREIEGNCVMFASQTSIEEIGMEYVNSGFNYYCQFPFFYGKPAWLFMLIHSCHRVKSGRSEGSWGRRGVPLLISLLDKEKGEIAWRRRNNKD